MKRAKQILDYVSTQDKAMLAYTARDMLLAAHSDAGYLNDTNARSRAGGHFFLSNNAENPANNGAILTIAQIIKNVMTSAVEAGIGDLYIIVQEAVYIRIILNEMGHKYPRTPVQTDNSTAEGVINNKMQPNQTKAIAIHFHLLLCKPAQAKF